jgi:xanthine phosphoribosyltransferase
MPHYRYVSWNEIQQLSQTLARLLAGQGPWDSLVAVTRGGLIPAGLVAHSLGITLIDTFCLTSYAGTTQGELVMLKAPTVSGRVLVIDELSDTGSTARLIRQHLPDAYIATLFAKPAGQNAVDTYAVLSPQDVWLCFPWEERAAEAQGLNSEPTLLSPL